MEEIELRLVANNVQAVKSVKELAAESDKLYKNNEKNQKREKDTIESLSRTLDGLKEKRKNSFNVAEMDKYTKKIEETKGKLKELEGAQEGVEKQGSTMMSSIGKWALGFASIATAVNLLKNAFQATEAGLRTFNVVGAVTKQILYDMVTVGKLEVGNIILSIKANKEMEAVRIKQRKDLVDIAQAQKLFNELTFAAYDRTKTQAERLTVLNQAMIAHEVIVEKKIENAKEELRAIELALAARPEETKLLDAHAQKLSEIIGIESERFTETKRLESLRTGIIAEEREKQLKIDKDYIENSKKFWSDYDKWFMDNLEKLQSEPEKIDEFFKEWERQTLIDIEQREKNLKKDADVIKQFFADWERETEIDIKKRAELQAEEAEFRKQRIEGLKDAAFEIAGLLEGITQRNYEDAKRNREILDSRISETQRSLDQEIELYKSGYASNVAAKQREIDNLKVLRDKALKEEEAARNKQLSMERIIQTANLVSSASNILKQTTKWGPIGIAIGAAAIAAMFTLLSSVKSRASESTKLATGGHGEVTGRLHSQGGESFLSHVEVEQGERWGVLSRPASRRYGKVFGQMVDSFNRNQLVIPKGPGTVNNILLDTSMTNGRLERVENQLIKLNQYFEGQETMSDNGKRSVIKKGSTTRIIKHR